MTGIIVTIVDPSPNFGNRLQHYAVQQVLKNYFGDSLKSLAIDKPISNSRMTLKKLIHSFSFYKLTDRKDFWKYTYKKVKKFDKFNRETFDIVYIEDLKYIPEADYYIVGSDQVWNPEWYDKNPLKKDLFFLTFTTPEKKVCFSPSIAVKKLPSEWEEWFSKYLITFPKISVREFASVSLVKELTGKDPTVLIDPTLMLDTKEWEDFSKKPKGFDENEKYVLTYFLGEESDIATQIINNISTVNNFSVHRIMDVHDKFYAINPQEFIYLVKNATLVLTDSFHACVFSFILNSPFLVFERVGHERGMGSRIESLLGTIGQEKRYIKQIDFQTNLEEMMKCDYTYGKKVIEKERYKVKRFLSDSMPKLRMLQKTDDTDYLE